jgi:hypothetical protein
MIRSDLCDSTGTINLALAALKDEHRLYSKERIQALQQAAHGHAQAGDRQAVDDALDRAADLLAGVDDDHPWFNACRTTPGYIEAQRATCYTRLGLGHEAANLWEQIIAGLPSTARRDEGIYRARQATACAQVGDLDSALDNAPRASNAASQTGSFRLRRELETLQRSLETKHGTHAAATQTLANLLARM